MTVFLRCFLLFFDQQWVFCGIVRWVILPFTLGASINDVTIFQAGRKGVKNQEKIMKHRNKKVVTLESLGKE